MYSRAAFPNKQIKMTKQKQMAPKKKKKKHFITSRLFELVCLQIRTVKSVNHLYRCPSLHSEPEAASGPTAALDSKDEPTGSEGSPGQWVLPGEDCGPGETFWTFSVATLVSPCTVDIYRKWSQPPKNWFRRLVRVLLWCSQVFFSTAISRCQRWQSDVYAAPQPPFARKYWL